MKTNTVIVIVIFTFLLSDFDISGAETSSYSNEDIFHAIQNSLHSGWEIVEKNLIKFHEAISGD